MRWASSITSSSVRNVKGILSTLPAQLVALVPAGFLCEVEVEELSLGEIGMHRNRAQEAHAAIQLRDALEEPGTHRPLDVLNRGLTFVNDDDDVEVKRIGGFVL